MNAVPDSPAKLRISINGRFLGRPVTGVERYGREVLRTLDNLLGETPHRSPVRVLVPRDVDPGINLRHIGIDEVGRLKGHAWEQIELARAARDDVLISLANSGPISHFAHVAVLHDAAVFRFPQNYRLQYRLLHRFLSRRLASTAHIMTVSEFSRQELCYFLGVPRHGISVSANGGDHLRDVVSDSTILRRLNIGREAVFLTVGSASYNKNLAVVLKAWSLMPKEGAKLIIVGLSTDRVFGTDLKIAQLTNVVEAGRVSDEELAALYKRADVFVFPSRYEGFGIPPLEAMFYDCTILASDIPAVKEVCGSAAHYFAVDDAKTLARLMQGAKEGVLSSLPERADERVARFTWARSAAHLLRCANSLALKHGNKNELFK